MTTYYFPNEFRDTLMRPESGSTARSHGLGKFNFKQDEQSPKRQRSPGPVKWIPRTFSPVLEETYPNRAPGHGHTKERMSPSGATHASAQPMYHSPYYRPASAMNSYAHYARPQRPPSSQSVPTPHYYNYHEGPYTVFYPRAYSSTDVPQYSRRPSTQTYMPPPYEELPYHIVPVVKQNCDCDPCPLHGQNCKHVKGMLPVLDLPDDPLPTPEKFVEVRETVHLPPKEEDIESVRKKTCSSSYRGLFITMWIIIGAVVLAMVLGLIFWAVL